MKQGVNLDIALIEDVRGNSSGGEIGDPGVLSSIDALPIKTFQHIPL